MTTFQGDDISFLILKTHFSIKISYKLFVFDLRVLKSLPVHSRFIHLIEMKLYLIFISIPNKTHFLT